MRIKITRDQIDNIITGILRDTKDNVIVTGLDGSGKSTIVKQYFGLANILQLGEGGSKHYFGSPHTAQFINEYIRIFDRHPLIDNLVYEVAWREDQESINDVSLLSSFNNFDYKFIKNIILLLDDEFLPENHESHWTTKKRKTIIYCYKKLMEYIETKYKTINIYTLESNNE